MIGNLCRQIAAITVTGLLAFAPVPGMAQNQPPAQTPATDQQNATPAPIPQQAPPTPGQPFRIPLGPDYSLVAARPYFPHVLLPYKTMHMDDAQLSNSARIQQLIQNDQLKITVQDAIELALENNTDISVQRYNSWLWETDILRAQAGNTIRGVAATGTNLPIANLPLIAYDPTLQVTFAQDTKLFPVNNPLTAGTGTGGAGGASVTTVETPGLGTHTLTGNFAYSQGFSTGTTITASLDSNRASTTSSAVTFNPAINTVGTFSFTQQLLNGFGIYTNDRYIKVAKIGKKASDYGFLQSVLTDVTSVENDYWELVYARNNVAVQQRAVDEAQRLYEDNERQVQVGTLAPIEVVQAEAQIASAQQSLITAQTTQLQDQALLMSVITKDPLAPGLIDVEIVPQDTVETPPLIENIPIVDAVKEAMADRPDVLETVTNLDADDINVKNTRAALLPSLVLSGYVNSVGLSGNSKSTVAGVTTVVPSGWFTSTGDLFQGEFPEYEAQIALNIPIRNRSNEADSARALLVKRQDQEHLQQTYNTVAVDVRNAQITLQQARAALNAAQKTRQLQEQTLAAEQTKFQLGASTVFNVVTDQATLETAAGAEVRAESNLAEAVVNFERAMGRTLKSHNITIADAQSGSPSRDTLIPGTNVAGEVVPGQKPGY